MEMATTDQTGRRNLVEQVADGLRSEIQSSRYRIGDKLPSESQLTAQFGVSRTVIREAVANLRADGMVQARQGAGVFVTATQPQGASAFQGVDTDRISSMIEILEVRTAIELEAAALAATRRSPAQDEAIYEMHTAFLGAMKRGADTLDEDFGFHLAIADATNNPRFRELLEMFGKLAIPRQSLQRGERNSTSSQYMSRIADEHRTIADAISARDEDAAREAMRTHLRGSQERYRSLLRTRSG